MAFNIDNTVGVPLEPTYDYEYELELVERFHKRVPNKVFDAHFHLSPEDLENVPLEKRFDVYRSQLNAYLGDDKLKGGLVMGNPYSYLSGEKLNADREFACNIAEIHEGFVSGLVIRPEENTDTLQKYYDMLPNMVALKPYRSFAIAEDTFEADILDYAPEWMWEFANDKELSVVVHLSHYGDMLKDKNNGEQIQYICKKYPKVKMILAHCAIGHHPDKLKSGLPYLDGLDNVYMDCSGVADALSIIHCIQALGTKRLMYGSDGYNYAFGRSSRIVPVGGNFLDIRPPKGEMPDDYKYKPIRVVCENLLATFTACDVLGIDRKQIEDMFYNNAAELFYPLVRE